jgi:hypothetical protein
MNTSNLTIWNELAKSDYEINHIQMQILSDYIEIEIKFKNEIMLEEFKTKIFNQIYQNTNTNYGKLSLCLQSTKKNNIVNLFEKLNYPINVDMMSILVDQFCSKKLLSNISDIKLPNLPEQLTELQIISLIPFDLSNLPTKIFLLDISKSKYKYNLDYLPNSIKILYLPSIQTLIPNENKYIYKLSDLSNLPTSLTEIYLGGIVFNSMEKLFENFDSENNLKLNLIMD